MSEETIVHGAYRYRPEESGEKYITLWFETGSSDVQIETNTDEFADVTTLDELVVALADKLPRKAPIAITGTLASLNDENPVAASGQLIYIQDKNWVKIGDGVKTFRTLGYPSTRVLDDVIDRVNHGVPIYGTKEELRNYDPEFIMGTGQVAFETDTGRIKLGDGIHTVPETPYYYIPDNYGKQLPGLEEQIQLLVDGMDQFLPIIDTQYSMSVRAITLNKDQIGIESDTGRVRVGDGVTEWASLPYIDPEHEQGLIDALATLVQLNVDLAPVYKTRAEWDAENPVLDPGRLGIESDTHLAKIGQGEKGDEISPLWLSSKVKLTLSDGNTEENKELVKGNESRWDILPYLSSDPEKTVQEIQKVIDLLETLVPIIGTSDDLAVFASNIPAKGKMIRDTTLSKYKVGDGVTTLANLPWLETVDVGDDSISVDADVSRVQMRATGELGEDIETNTERIEGVPEGGEIDPNDDVYFAVQGEVNNNE